jgi:hypothetical protein
MRKVPVFKRFVFFLVLSMPALVVCSQNDSVPIDSARSHQSTLRPGRLAITLTAETAIAVGTLIGLNDLWYKDYPRTGFHFFNDNHEWLQMDKMGHAYTAYQLSMIGHSALRWSGVKRKPCIWYGAATGITYQLIIEMLDAFSAEWGFSWGDFSGNVIGGAVFASQQLVWNEQRIIPKFSYHYSSYAEKRPDMLGTNYAERLLKDYNGQTYWLTVAPGSFMKPEKKFPRWAAISIGYSAEGMLGAETNETAGRPEYMDIARNRRFLLSLDVDFSKIPVKNKTLKTLFSLINTLKVPFPALEYNTGRGFLGHWVYL